MDLIKSIEFIPDFDQRRILEGIQCASGSPSYRKASEMYHMVLAELLERANPQIWIKFCEDWTMPILKENGQPHSSVALCLMTMGCKVEEYLKECFMARKSLKGILADFMASTYMFQLDSRCLELVRAECGMRKQGVRERLEAPDQLPWEAAGRILEEIEMEETTGITVSPSGIFTPPRTQAYMLLLSEDSGCFHAEHDCTRCRARDCRWRNQ